MRELINLSLLFYYFLRLVKCMDVDSYEFNRIELTPIHDAIILNDIADIMNELDNNMKPSSDDHKFSNSESNEDIENLLSEYQQYLDKAHEQTVNYIKKSKTKNKVPLLRHEKFTKLNPILRSNLEDSNNFFDVKHSPPTFINKFFSNIPHLIPVKASENWQNFMKSSHAENKIFEVPSIIPKTSPELLLSSCLCKENVIPCQCGCNQCIMTNSGFKNSFNKDVTDKNPFTKGFLKYSKASSERYLDNHFNIRIKIDVQLPNMSNITTGKDTDEMSYGITRTISLPFPYMNFPIPIEVTKYEQNALKDILSPMHKITIHKKKKYRANANNKKHKNRKFITLHHFQFEPQTQQNVTGDTLNNSNSTKINSINIVQDDTDMKNLSENTQTKLNTTTEIATNTKNNQPLETIYLTLNISKESSNNTEGKIKSGNSIETDTSTDKDNITLKAVRLKREIKNNISKNITDLNNTLPFDKIKNNTVLSPDRFKKNNSKDFVADRELLYWPLSTKNQSIIRSKNITALILDREIRKVKLNMTENNIRNNRTMVLEKAIFGNVNWNDVDIVVPVFMSFIGKYIRGVLTFCSESICHSMKCAEKICYHRICTLDNRYHGGHCTGNNETDSVATMESTMDLPSNIAFEIVDILEAKMIGKLFGKITLCINTKCSAFVTYKKKFLKAKCSFKDLNSSGHCPNTRNYKKYELRKIISNKPQRRVSCL